MSKKKPTTEQSESIGVEASSPEAIPPPLPDTPPPLPNGEMEEFVGPQLSSEPSEPQLAPEPVAVKALPVVAPVAQPAPPVAAAVAVDPALEERLRRLEALLAQTQQSLQTAQQNRITDRTQTREPAPAGPSIFGQARALIDVGKHLLPALPPGQAPPQVRGWFIWEMIAEVRAMACMYLDPRYRVSWWDYVAPPILLAAFLLQRFWLPFYSLLAEIKLGWLLTIPTDLILLYALFKILGYEARRYRETAPDLPPSLRL